MSFVIRSLSNGKLITRAGLGKQLELQNEKVGQAFQKWELSAADEDGQMILNESGTEAWVITGTSPSTPVLGYPLPAPLGSFYKWKLSLV